MPKSYPHITPDETWLRRHFAEAGESSDFPLSDWRYEVKNGDTRLGYWEWLAHRYEGEQFSQTDQSPAVPEGRGL